MKWYCLINEKNSIKLSVMIRLANEQREEEAGETG